MYRIRVISSDGTLGGFFTGNGISKSVSDAKKYSSSLDMQTDLVRAYYVSGGLNQPYVNYNVDTQGLADEEKSKYDASILIKNSFVGREIVSDLGTKKPVKPPFQDKPSETDLGQPGLPESIIIDVDGGYLSQAQIIDIDPGGA